MLRLGARGPWSSFAICCVAILAACGGGGGSSPPDAAIPDAAGPEPETQADAALDGDSASDTGPSSDVDAAQLDVDVQTEGPDTDVDGASDTALDADAEPGPDIAPDAGPDVDPDIDPDPGVDPDTVPDVDPDPDVGPDPDADALSADQTPPQVTIAEPTEGEAVVGAALVVTGTVDDPEGEVPASGVVEVRVNGHLAALEADGSFSWGLTNLTPETTSVVVTALDAAGNEGSATVGISVTEALAGLGVEPPTVVLVEVGETAQLAVEALYEGAFGEPLSSGVTFSSQDGAIATVSAGGLVTAVGDGIVPITASYQDQSTQVMVVVQIDDDPPPSPRVITYLPETNLPAQTWLGRAEPGATLTVVGAAAPIAPVVVDEQGRFRVNVPLAMGDNAISLTLADGLGNTSEVYDFPVRYDPSHVDVGAVHVSSGDVQTGVAGQELLQALVVKATDALGKPLGGVPVAFEVIEGDGLVRADVAGAPPDAAASVRTDALGYARVRYTLSPHHTHRNRVCARLEGDTGLPAIFTAQALPERHGPASISGVVLDEHMRGVAAATVFMVGTPVSVQTDERGRFTLTWAPALPEPTEPLTVKLLVNGYTATNPPAAGTFARLAFDIDVLPGQPNRVLRPFFLPFIPEGVELPLDGEGKMTESLVLERAFAPGQPPTRVHVPAGTKIIWPEGLPDPQKRLVMVDIPINRTPMPLPDGLFSRHVIAVQPGGTRFEPPLPVEFPNVDGEPPGAQVAQLAWDHDLGRFSKVGTATVTDDGSYAITDPGSGIKIAAWHPSPPEKAEETCNVRGTVDPEAKGPCTCTLGGKTMPCEPGETFDMGSVPCDGQSQEVDVECAEEYGDNRVTIELPEEEEELGHAVVPISGAFGPATLIRADVDATAGCEQVVDEWLLDTEVIAENTNEFEYRFEKEGKHVLIARIQNDGYCGGEDRVVVEAMECCSAGSVRACGEKITLAGETPSGHPRYRVSGDVTVGRSGGAQPIRFEGSHLDCEPFGSEGKLKGQGNWWMNVKDERLDIFHGTMTIARTGVATLGMSESDDWLLTIAGFELSRPEALTVVKEGFAATLVPIDLGLSGPGEIAENVCVAPKVDAKFGSFLIYEEGLLPGGTIEFTGNVPIGALWLHKLKMGYLPESDEFVGGVKVRFGAWVPILPSCGDPPVHKSVALDIEGRLREGRPSAFKLEATLPSLSPFGNGIPLAFAPPPSPPIPILFWEKARIGIENMDYFFRGDGEANYGYPIFSGGSTFGIGPGVNWPSPPIKAKLGTLDIDVKAQTYPIELTLTGALAMGQLTVLDSDFTLMNGSVEAFFGYDPLKFRLTAKIGLGLPSAGQQFKPPGEPAPKPKPGDPKPLTGSASGNILEGEVSLTASNNNGFTAIGQVKGALKTPAVTIGSITIGQRTLAGASATETFVYDPFRFAMTATATYGYPGLGNLSLTAGFDVPGPKVGTDARESKCTFDVFGLCVITRLCLEPAGITAWVLGGDPRCVGSTEVYRDAFAGEGMTVEVPDTDAVEIILTHDAHEFVKFDLMAPDGTLLEAEAPFGESPIPAMLIRSDLDPRRSVWLVYSPPPGTWQLVNVTPADTAKYAVVALPDSMPTFSWSEPFEVVDEVATLAFDAADADSDASVVLTYAANPDDEAGETIATFDLSEGVTSVDWDLSGLEPGAWFVCASISDADTPARRVCAEQPVVVEALGQPIPRLVRAEGLTGGLEVTWLAASEGDVTYDLTLTPALGGEVSSTRIDAPRTRATLTGLPPGAEYLVQVAAVDADGVRGPRSPAFTASVPGSQALHITSTPPPTVRVGNTWTYTPEAVGGAGVGTVSVAVGPVGMTAQSGTVEWTPETGKTLEVTLVVADAAGGPGASQTFQLTASEDNVVSPPEILSAPPSYAVIGELWAYQPVVHLLEGGVADIALESGPPGMSLAPEGTLEWTPQVDDVLDLGGVAAFTLRVTGPEGQSRTQTGLVRFDDADDDGLPLDYELASGLDPLVADDAGADPDGDGLDHTAELLMGTRGDVADSDGDGFPDGEEIVSSPRLADTDDDGLTDDEELVAATDPTLPDSDGDGVGDAEEVALGTNPNAPPADADGDALSDDLEAQLGTDPALADGDEDGLDDAQEIELGTDPYSADSDGDGVDDATELAQDTSPLTAGGDTDGDGLYDHLEVLLGTDSNNRDTDGDGWADGEEHALGSDPLDDDLVPGLNVPEPTEIERRALIGSSNPTLFAPFEAVDVGVIKVFRDDDLDGVPDDYELTWSYDNTDPSDALSDDDGDGLQLWQEAQAGTNPTAADSDGDGVPDGQELQDGTDPLDGDDYDTGGPVTSLVVQPSEAWATSNAVLGDAEVQLVVLGLKDSGVTVDLTKAETGTSYLLSDPTFGTVSPDGLFRHEGDAGSGDIVLTVFNGSLSAEVPIHLDLFTPGAVAALELDGDATDLAVDGARLVVAVDEAVQVVDVEIPASPALTAAADLEVAVEDVALAGSLAAAALGDQGVALIDLADPYAPTLVARVPLAGAARAVALSEVGLAVATDQGLALLDVSTPGMGLLDADANGVDDRVWTTVQTSVAYTHVATSFGRVFGVTAPGQLTGYTLVTGPAGNPGLAFAAQSGVGVPDGLTALGSQAWTVFNGGVHRFEFGADPVAQSTALGIAPSGALASYQDVVLAGRQLATANLLVTVVDAGVIGSLPVLGNIDYSAVGDHQDVFDIDVQGEFHYLTVAGGTLIVGRHAQVSDTLGQPPLVELLAPTSGSSLVEGTPVDIEVRATDDVQVSAVEILVDGEPFALLEAPPYEATLKLPDVQADTPLTIEANAVDLGDNVGVALPVSVQVTPVVDTEPPLVALVSPPDGTTLTGGAVFMAVANPLDNHYVKAVRFLVDGVEAAVVGQPPYEAQLTMPLQAANPEKTVTITAEATDYGGNQGSGSVTLLHGGLDLVAMGVTEITPGDTTYDGADISILGGEVLIDGVHAFGRVVIGDGGVLSHPDTPFTGDEPQLTLVADELVVEAGGAIDVTSKGYEGACQDPGPCLWPFGPGNVETPEIEGGGSHGGRGGSPTGIEAYGDYQAPGTLGSGGSASSYNSSNRGGDGGGRIDIAATTVVIEGELRADGGDAIQAYTSDSASGGAGGSIRIVADVVSGSGAITANGGAGGGADNDDGGGGGGRIAIVASVDASAFDPAELSAYGGGLAHQAQNGRTGAPGTIYLELAGSPTTVLIDAGAVAAGPTSLSLGAQSTGEPAGAGMDLVVSGEARVVTADPLNLGALVLEGGSRLSIRDALVADTITLSDTSILTHPPTRPDLEAGLTIDAGGVTVGVGATIDVSRKGYVGECRPLGDCFGQYGPGNVQFDGSPSGGSHGGLGGGPALIDVYGDWLDPFTLGSGGDAESYNSSNQGGTGGGRVRLNAETLVLEGSIRADGGDGNGAYSSDSSCGGAGGSVNVNVQTLSGGGIATANGGRGRFHSNDSGGGGGRVAIVAADASGFTGSATTYGGGVDNGSTRVGGAGTTYLDLGLSASGPTVIVDSGTDPSGAESVPLEASPLDASTALVVRGNARIATAGPLSLASLTIEGDARLGVYDSLTIAGDLMLAEQGTLTHTRTTDSHEAGLDLAVGGTIHVAAGAAIDVSGRGYLGECRLQMCVGAFGPGNVPDTSTVGGGSHGGLGGGSNVFGVYGDWRQPTTLGGGGDASAYNNSNLGGSGGGRLHIQSADALVLDGELRANGQACTQNYGSDRCSGGAGGSIWVEVDSLQGTGSIRANGGLAGGSHNQSYGGGGGRIAVYVLDAAGFAPAAIEAHGAGTASDDATRRGGQGTILLAYSGSPEQLILDNGGLPGPESLSLGTVTTGTAIGAAGPLEVYVTGAARAELLDALQVDALVISGTARLRAYEAIATTTLDVLEEGILTGTRTDPSYESQLVINATSATVAALAAIDLSDVGYLGGCQMASDCQGAMGEGNSYATGAGPGSAGSHGGVGGGANAPPVYGSPLSPFTLGGGGHASSYNGSNRGGNGGGRVQLTVGSLVLDGAIRADGGPPDQGYVSDTASGGAGGSVHLVVDTLSGAGAISANGSDGGANGQDSGGGGGRVHVEINVDATGFDMGAVTATGGIGPTGKNGTEGSVQVP